MTNIWLKVLIEIESVTANGFAFASSDKGIVFVPKSITEDADLHVGDIIFATIRPNYADKRDAAPFLCVRLDLDHPSTQQFEDDLAVEQLQVGHSNEEAPQTQPSDFSNVVALVNGTELIHAAHDHLFLVLLDLPQKELDEMILDVLHHDHNTTQDVLCSILSVDIPSGSILDGVKLAALTRIETAINNQYLIGNLVKLMRSTIGDDGVERETISYTTTQRASDQTFM